MAESVQMPSVGRIVHYVSYGTPGGEYGKECRAAVVTEVDTSTTVGLAILNPTGMFFNRTVTFHSGKGQPARLDCPQPHENGPHRYCGCGWTEDAYMGGTWHWPERVDHG